MKTKIRILVGSAILVAVLTGILLGSHFKTRPVQPVAPVDEAATLSVDSSGGTVPLTFNCDEGRIVVAPVVQNGQKRYELTCTQGELNEATTPAVLRQNGNASPTYENVGARRNQNKKSTSWKRHALIIGGGALGGTAIGGIAGGRKGAAIGAASGGVAGLIYHLATKK